MKRTTGRFRPQGSTSRLACGFTIPEVLAVVAVIMIVLSMMLPNLRQGREIARETVCQSNLHHIAIGSRNYATDTRYMPNAYYGGYIVWLPEVYRYNPDPDAFYCPTAPPSAKWPGMLKGGGLPAENGYLENEQRISIYSNFSYGHNNGGSADGAYPWLGVGDYVFPKQYQDPSHVPHYPTLGWILAAKVKAPSNFIMYGDSTVDGLWDHFIDEDYEDGTGRTEYPADRHRQGAFLAFGDGHIEHQLQKYLIHLGPEGTALPEQRRRWNNDNEPH